MIRWHEWALSALDKNDRIAMIMIADASGSAPREAGTRMFVTADTQLGTIGGGNLEYSAVAAARTLLVEQPPSAVQIDDYALGPELEQCCGGYVRVLSAVLSCDDRSWLEEISQLEASGFGAVIESSVTKDNRLKVSASKCELAQRHDRSIVSTVGTPNQKNENQKIVERVSGYWAAVSLFGAGHVGQAVSAALAPLPLYIRWYEGRPDYLPASVHTNIEVCAASEPTRDVADAPPHSFFLTFTHSHELDYQTVKAVLSRGDFEFCGLIGSHTKRASFERRFRDDGLTDAQVKRLVCPIGLPSLKSKDPNVIAVGVAAQIMSLVEKAEGGDRGH